MILKYIFTDFFKNEKKVISFWILSILIFYIFQVAILPNIFGRLSSNINKLKSTWEFDFKNYNILTYLLLIFGIMIVVAVFEKIKKGFESYLQPKYLLYLRKVLLEKILKRYSQNFKDLNKGDIVSRIVTITNGIWDSIYIFSNSIFQRIIAILITIIYFFIIDSRLGVSTLLLSLTYLFIFYKNIIKGIKMSMIKEKKVFELSEQLNDQLSNLMNVYINNQQDNVISKSNYFLSKYGDSINKEVKTYGNIFLINNSFLIVISVVLLLIAFLQLSSGNINSVNFISIIVIIGMYIHNGYLINQESYPFIIKMAPLVSSKDFLTNIFNSDSSGDLKKKINGRIQFKNVFFRYSNEQAYVLNNLSFTIQPRQKVAIIGKSGSGKSTICKLLLRFYQGYTGDILIDNVPISKYNSHFLRTHINYVNQKTQLFNKTVVENINLDNKVKPQLITNLLNKYKLNVFINLPKGIYSNVGVDGSNLSLGMQKIVILLRGILRPSKVIIFDEPLAGLDPKSRKNVIKLIKDTCHDKTVIIVTHEQEIIPYVNKVIQLNTTFNSFNSES